MEIIFEQLVAMANTDVVLMQSRCVDSNHQATRRDCQHLNDLAEDLVDEVEDPESLPSVQKININSALLQQYRMCTLDGQDRNLLAAQSASLCCIKINKSLLKTQPFLHKRSNIDIFSVRKMAKAATKLKHEKKYGRQHCNQMEVLRFSKYFCD